jgi:hypothetical protein
MCYMVLDGCWSTVLAKLGMPDQGSARVSLVQVLYNGCTRKTPSLLMK